MKKGQVSIFMLLGIFVFLLALILIYVNSQYHKNNPDIITGNIFDIQPFSLFIENCVNDIGYDALYYLGKGGGSIAYDGSELITSYSIIDFLYDEEQNKVHSTLEMEEQLSLYMEEMLNSCLNNFTDFKGYNFSYGAINAGTIIREEDVIFQVHYPIKIKGKESTKEISDFSATLPVRMGHIREIVYSIVDNQLNDPGWVDMTYMSDFDVNVSIYPYNTTVLVYGIIDDKSLIYNEPYEFLFANKFEDE
ncbi:hypothetical protein ISS05_01755 [Candidatus Woesearchaeota archaeon]|nr:hypothetical protein [Candidatus Woesearchaeota archaeon]